MPTARVKFAMLPTASSSMRQSNIISHPTLPYSQRRPSIRRGTISSLSKDVRANNYEDAIKLQKAIKQKERDVDTTSRLRGRCNMLNTSNRVPNKKSNPPSRIPILSNRGLKAPGTNAPAAVSNNNNSNTDNAPSPRAVTINRATSSRIRLDGKVKGKCETPKTKAEVESQPALATSSITSNDNTASSYSSSIVHNHINCNSLSYLNSRYSSILRELNQCMYKYATQLNQVVSQNDNSNIQACKFLIAQQQELLDQLEKLDTQIARINLQSSSSMEFINGVLGSILSSMDADCTTTNKARHPIYDGVKKNIYGDTSGSYKFPYLMGFATTSKPRF